MLRLFFYMSILLLFECKIFRRTLYNISSIFFIIFLLLILVNLYLNYLHSLAIPSSILDSNVKTCCEDLVSYIIKGSFFKNSYYSRDGIEYAIYYFVFDFGEEKD